MPLRHVRSATICLAAPAMLALAWAGTAVAQTVAQAAAPDTAPVLADPASVVPPTEPDFTNLPVVQPEPVDLDAVARAALDEFEPRFEAMQTENILAAIGSVARIGLPPVRSARGTGGPDDPFTVKTPGSVRPPPTLAQIANPSFGSHNGVAVSIAEKIVATGPNALGMNADIHMEHQAGAVDAALDLAGRSNFAVPDPMAVSYDGHALVALNRIMQVGVAARGSLGTISAPGFVGTQTAGPRFRLNLADQNLTLASDVAYDFGLNQGPNQSGTTLMRPQLKMQMSLKLKL